MEDPFLKSRLLWDSYEGRCVIWEVIARRRKAFFDELIIYWQWVLGKSEFSLLQVFSRTGSQDVRHNTFCWKLAWLISLSNPTNIFYTLAIQFPLRKLTLVNENRPFIEEKLMAIIKNFCLRACITRHKMFMLTTGTVFHLLTMTKLCG